MKIQYKPGIYLHLITSLCALLAMDIYTGSFLSDKALKSDSLHNYRAQITAAVVFAVLSVASLILSWCFSCSKRFRVVLTKKQKLINFIIIIVKIILYIILVCEIFNQTSACIAIIIVINAVQIVHFILSLKFQQQKEVEINSSKEEKAPNEKVLTVAKETEVEREAIQVQPIDEKSCQNKEENKMNRE
ncbi:Hypothetical_protein [Hexamita inflata]|uniref:Hypothetical_protein n=1 Tax=Hexamita inflata TaxID=28002 RepID=A0AA86V385_9EUKA|nr:Hypothetical protein HINF_LOCUS62207 [Hexamita inflata]